jgi:phosphoserine phosphatase
MMRISFDLDETIISRNIDWEVEPILKGFRGDEERLRKGTVELFKWIREQNHEIWIYTNSYRGRKALESWFQNCGIPVDGVINQFAHEQKRNEQDKQCRLEKNPKLFGIDLHFDDSSDLAEQEGVYKIDATDPFWTDTVKQYINEKKG